MVERLQVQDTAIVTPTPIEGWKTVEIEESGDPLVNLVRVPGILLNPQYFKQGIQGSIPDIFLRLGLLNVFLRQHNIFLKATNFLFGMAGDRLKYNNHCLMSSIPVLKKKTQACRKKN